MSTRNFLRGLKGSRNVRLTAPSPSMSWLFRKCGSLDVSESYRRPGPVIRRVLLFMCIYILFVHKLVAWGAMLQAALWRVWVPMLTMNIFNLSNPSGRAMALGLTLTEVTTRKYFWGVERGLLVRLATWPPSVGRFST
jgi:hypothetical protein